MLVKKKYSKEDIEKFKELRKEGYSYSDISIELKVPVSSIMYHLNENYRKNILKYSNKNRKSKEYMRGYMKKRYAEDPEFREKQKKRTRDLQREKRKK